MIDAWSGPTPTPQQFPGHAAPGDGIGQLLGMIQSLRQEMRELKSNLLGPAGIHLSPAGMTIDSNLALTGTLSLPAGIIDNAALTSPVVPGIVNFTDTGFAVSLDPSWTNGALTTITVPARLHAVAGDLHR